MKTRSLCLVFFLSASICRAEDKDLNGSLPVIRFHLPSAGKEAVLKPVSGTDSSLAANLRRTLDGKSDLSAQWEDVSRSQGAIGDCHAFASVAGLEAAWSRAHSGRHIRLNEEDLFLSGTFLNPGEEGALAGYCNSGICGVEMGNYVADDVRFAFKYGISQVNVDRERLAVLRADFYRAAYYFERDTYHAMEAQNEKMKAQIASGKMANTPMDRYRERRAFAREQLTNSPQIDKLKGIIREESGGNDPAQERDWLKRELKGYKLFRKASLIGDDKRHESELKKGQCQETKFGRRMREDLVNELRGGHPVVVGMNLKGLSKWNSEKEDVFHAFVVKGYHAEGADILFQTRNSWGPAEMENSSKPDNPDLSGDDLCRIRELALILNPDEVPVSGDFKLEAVGGG